MSNQVSLAMKTLKVKDNKVDAKSSLWNMLGSCKTIFIFFYSWLINNLERRQEVENASIEDFS